jgi:hypothetical protein
MTSAPLPADPAAQRAFVLAGRAVFTVQNAATGGRFTYRVRRHAEGVAFVSLLNGPDNATDYTFLGTLWQRRDDYWYWKHSAKSRVNRDAPSARAFAWLWRFLSPGVSLPPSVTLWHQGRCGKCGRPLAVPESIARGFGPECAGSVG